jgi:predicted GIY-YIG superfamily endonuclease
MYSVYWLKENEDIRWVGITKAVKRRKYSHTSGREAKMTSNMYYRNWYAKLETPPMFEVICEGLTKENALIVESELIRNFRRAGCKLVNLATEGNVPDGHGEKIADAWKRGSYTETNRKRSAAYARGDYDYVKAKVSAGVKKAWEVGKMKPTSPEHMAKLQACNEAKKVTIECTHIATGEVQVVRSFRAAAAVANTSAGNVSNVLNPKYGPSRN